MTADLRPELPPMPPRIAKLPRARGYPVPWFVAWVDADGKPTEVGEGTPDFRIIRPGGVAIAWSRSLCWICGGMLTRYRSFVSGPMCAVNRTSAEPPSCFQCATWSALVCPFLTRPHAKRRESRLPDGLLDPAGIALRRNPGVTIVWTTRRPRVKHQGPDGVLFDLGPPEHVEWYAEGREATRDEILASINSGLPSLRELAEAQGPPAVRELGRLTDTAMKLVPA